jgi:hypothetical protein
MRLVQAPLSAASEHRWRPSNAERRAYHRFVSGEDWRVEVELNDEQHGYSLGEWLRAFDLDDAARERLGRHVIVSRDGSKLFLYTSTQDEADEAARVVRKLTSAESLTAEIRTTRWHPVEEAWKDASVPLPHTEAEQALERQSREERERREVEAGADYDWHVHVRARDRAEAATLERNLLDQSVPVKRRWRFLTIGALTKSRRTNSRPGSAASSQGPRSRSSRPSTRPRRPSC